MGLLLTLGLVGLVVRLLGWLNYMWEFECFSFRIPV